MLLVYRRYNKNVHTLFNEVVINSIVKQNKQTNNGLLASISRPTSVQYFREKCTLSVLNGIFVIPIFMVFLSKLFSLPLPSVTDNSPHPPLLTPVCFSKPSLILFIVFLLTYCRQIQTFFGFFKFSNLDFIKINSTEDPQSS